MLEDHKTKRSIGALLCVACFMVCALDAVQLTMPQNYGFMTPESADWYAGAFYRVLFGSPVVLLVMASGIALLSPLHPVTMKELWLRIIAKYAAAYALWSLIYALYRIHRMDPQPKITAGLLIQQWMAEPEHLWFLTMMIGLFILVPLLRTITATNNTKLFRYMIILFVGALLVAVIFTWPGLSHGEHFIFPALEKTPITLICQYVFWMLLGWIAYIWQPSPMYRCVIYAVGILAVVILTILSLSGTLYPFGITTVPVLGEFSLFAFFKNIALFYIIITLVQKLERPLKEGSLLKALSECWLTVYLIHYLILSIMFDHEFLFSRGIPVWICVWIYATIAFVIGAVFALLIRFIWKGIRGIGDSGDTRAAVLSFVLIISIAAVPMVLLTERSEAAENSENSSEETRLDIYLKKDVSDAKFEASHVQMDLNRCRSSESRLVLAWNEVAGAKEYQIYRSPKKKGKYKKFAVVEDPVLKEKANGEYYYKVRAYSGSAFSHWSLPVHIFSQSGFIRKMYYDDFGYTHFQIHVDNRAGRSVYFLGPGLYNGARTQLYSVYKYEFKTVIEDGEEKIRKERTGHPYPMEAAPKLKMYQSKEIPSGGDGTDLDIYVPWKLPQYGEDGLRDERFCYAVEVSTFPEQRIPAFVLSITDDEKDSRSMGRADR